MGFFSNKETICHINECFLHTIDMCKTLHGVNLFARAEGRTWNELPSHLIVWGIVRGSQYLEEGTPGMKEMFEFESPRP